LGRDTTIAAGAYFFEALNKVSIATMLFKLGVLIVVFERVFEANYLALAFTPFSTRPFIGIHLWPSQIWFLLIGSLVAITDLFNRQLRLDRYMLKRSAPIFAVLMVYFLWTFYGVYLGNAAAIDLFREMLYAAFCFPAVLYLAQYVNVDEVFDKFFFITLLVFIFLGLNSTFIRVVPFIYQPSNDVLLVSSFTYAYFLLLAVWRSVYIIPAFLATLPILVNINKPMIALIGMLPLVIFFLIMVCTRKKLKYSLNIRSLKITGVFVIMFSGLILAALYLNHLLNGQIEMIFRDTFIKQRVTDTGQIYLGDMSGGRFTLWTNAIELWKSRPFLGNGLGTAVPIRDETLAHIHNYYIQALMDTGLLGFGILTVSWIVWFRRITATLRTSDWNYTKIIYTALLAFVAGNFVFAIYGLPLTYLGAAHFFWVAIALLTVLREEHLTDPGSHTEPIESIVKGTND
jgi:O-antigen ligase